MNFDMFIIKKALTSLGELGKERKKERPFTTVMSRAFQEQKHQKLPCSCF